MFNKIFGGNKINDLCSVADCQQFKKNSKPMHWEKCNAFTAQVAKSNSHQELQQVCIYSLKKRNIKKYKKI